MKHFVAPICRCIQKFVKDEAGQALVEASISTSFLLVFLLGAADLARAAYAAIEVANAAKAAVQYGAQNTTTAASTASIKAAAASDAGNLSGLTTTVALKGMCSNGNACTGTGGTCVSTDCSTSHIVMTLSVSTSATFNPLVHVPGLPSTFTLHGSAVQKVLNY